jgi:MFS transporter, DHA1 family, tetracycline resistance protein
MKNSPFLVIFLTVLIDLLGFGLVIPILPIFAKNLGASNAFVGIIIAVFALMNFIFTPYLGSLSDKIGRRPIILISIAVNIVANLVFSMATTLPILILSRMLGGIGSANIGAAQAYISDITKPEERAKYLGLIGAAFGIGFVIGPLVGGIIQQSWGISGLGYAAAALCAFNLVVAWLFLPESLKEKNRTVERRNVSISDFQEALKKPLIRELFWMSFVYISAFTLLQSTSSLLWKEHYGADETHINYLFATIGFFSMVVNAGMVGWLVRTFGEKNLLFYGNFFMVAGLLLVPSAPQAFFYPVAAFAIMLICIGSGCLTPNLTSVLSQNTAAHEQGKVLGLSQSFGSLARVIGPISAGFFYDAFYALPYYIAACLMLISAVLGRKVGSFLLKKSFKKAIEVSEA